MKVPHRPSYSGWLTSLGGALLLFGGTLLRAQDEDYDVLTRGPVHEAFAETVSFEPEPGLVIQSSPPDLIDELPPDQRPDGDHVTWIPGYWGWDDEQNDFLWISGVWRNLPPGRQWVPGYWNQVDSGYQWISGYWADSEVDQVTYLASAPPRSVESGPNIAAPREDYIWTPGQWRWAESRYRWQPGYWIEPRPRWTWVPAHYIWTPRGYVFVDGYWDYDFDNRGVLFAPVHFRNRPWERPHFHYTPGISIDLGILTVHLFVRPDSHHYYFGDYYAPRYRDAGYLTNFHWHKHHKGYDPIFVCESWRHRHDHGWHKKREDDYAFYLKNDKYRPPHTWSVMKGLTNMQLDGPHDRQRLLANTFTSVTSSPKEKSRFKPVEKDFHEKIADQRQQLRDLASNRQKLEVMKKSDKRPSVESVALPSSPLVGRKPAKNEGKGRPASPTVDDNTGKPSKESIERPDRGKPELPGNKKPEKSIDPSPGKGKPEKTVPERPMQEKPRPDKDRPAPTIEPNKPEKPSGKPQRQEVRPQPEKVQPSRPEKPSGKPQKQEIRPQPEKVKPSKPEKRSGKPQKQGVRPQSEKSKPSRDESSDSKGGGDSKGKGSKK